MSDPTSQGTGQSTEEQHTSGDSPAELRHDVDQLQQQTSTISEKVDQILGLVRGHGTTAPERSAPPAGGASGDSATAASVQEQVQAELAKAREAAERQEAADADKADRESVKERLARLEETPPAPAVRRSTRLLGWGDGR